MLRVRCYLDDLNFQYNVARPTSFKWIDLESLFRDILTEKLEQEVSIEQLKLFGAYELGDDASKRQKIYFNALQKQSTCISIQLGKFKKVKKKGVLEGRRGSKIVTITTQEEKQTDVNIAVSIVDDAHMSMKCKEFDMACLISNDSDLSAALSVTRRLRRDIVLITPVANNTKSTRSLIEHIPKNMRVSRINPDLLKKHLLPEQVGKYHAPKGWLGP